MADHTDLPVCGACGQALDSAAIDGLCCGCLAAAAFFDSGEPLSKPTRLGNYELIEEIGRGATGTVWRARQIGLNREVAVKVLRHGPLAGIVETTRFRREAAAAGRLRHPNIAAIHEVGEADGHIFFSMDLVLGPTLADIVRQGPLDPERAARYGRSIAEAINVAHVQGILHRDLKPSNIIINDDDQPQVLDFGLAKSLVDAEATVGQHIVGSPTYMPPEQANPARGPVTPASDVYALGALLYHLLTGRPPFQGDTLDSVLLQVQNLEPIPPRQLNPSLPRDLETICLKCLEKEPSQRYTTARDLADELLHFLRHEPIRARPIGIPGRLGRWCKCQPVAAGLAGLLACILILTAGAALMAARRIEFARRAEQHARIKAVEANARLSESVSFLELQRAERLFRADDASLGLAQLAGTLKRDRSNRIAAERILSALLQIDWVLPCGAPLRHSNAVFSVAFDSQGQYIVTACGDGFARVWNKQSRLEVVRLPHPDQVRSACFSPDGTKIATACVDDHVRIWDWRSATLTARPMRHDKFVMSVAFSPDGQRVVSGSGDCTARIWSTQTGEQLLTLLGHSNEVFQTVFSPDGNLVATASHDGTARLWNSRIGDLAAPVLRHSGRVLGVAFSPDGRRLATASRDRTAVVWDIATGIPALPPFRHLDGLNAVQFDASGRRLALAGYDNTVRLLDAATGRSISPLFRHAEQVNQATFCPDGNLLATAGDDGTVRIWDVTPATAGPERIPNEPQQTRRNWLEISPNGTWAIKLEQTNAAQVWDLNSMRPLSGAIRHEDEIVVARFSPNGLQVATASADQTACVWDARTGRPVTERLRHRDKVQDVCFSPDGTRVATASMDNTARIWEVQTGQPLGPPLRHLRTVVRVAFDPQGARVITASLDHTARIWSASDGAATTLPLEHEEGVLDAAFSPDGERVVTASADRTARVWDARTGLPLSDPLPHSGPVQSARFSATGQDVITQLLAPDSASHVWPVPRAPLQIPDWWAEFAEDVAGLAVEPRGTTHLVSPDDLEALSHRWKNREAQDVYERAALWLLSDRTKRGTSPFNSLKHSDIISP